MSIEAIVDSKLMVGANLPVCQVEISGGGLGEPTGVIVQGTVDYEPVDMTRWIPKTAGGYLCCYLNASKQLVTGTCSDLAFMDTDNAIESEVCQAAITATSAQANGMDLARLEDGSALLVILDKLAAQSTLKCYKSADGKGGNWAHLKDIDISQVFTGIVFADGSECHLVLGSNGDLIISANVYRPYFTTNAQSHGVIFKSTDGGATWVELVDKGGGLTATRGVSPVGLLPDRMWFHLTRVNYTTLYESTDGGATWTTYGDFGGTDFDSLVDTSLQGASSFYAPALNLVLVHLTYPFGGPNTDPGGLFQLTDPTTTRIDNHSNFERISSVGDLGLSASARVYTLGSTLVIQPIHDGKPKIYTVSPVTNALEGVTRSAVNHKLGSAAAATVVLDNPGGVYSYDGAANTHLVGPNAEITIRMGYGTALEKVFYGLIDKINEQSFPQKLTLNCRDMGKKALDGSITNAAGDHTVIFADATPEAIFRTLGTWAGYADIRTEETGITGVSKTWNWAKYVDAFDWLCGLSGFDWYCDNDGVLWFKKRATNVPRSEDEEHALVLEEGEYKCTLDHHPILDGSYAIKNVAEDVTYTKDTDYTLDLATGELVAVAGGSLAAGGTIHPKYTFPRHVFQEGVNLSVLNGYSIDDKLLFYKIYVYGKDSTGAVIAATWTMSSNTYNVSEDKHKKIDIAGVVTQTQLQAIADGLGADMLRKARVCSCKAVGVPTLNKGECIQIIESSSTVSEIYRATDVTHTFSGSGEPLMTSFTTYHYGYAPIVEGGDE